jgi:hypothetical protein
VAGSGTTVISKSLKYPMLPARRRIERKERRRMTTVTDTFAGTGNEKGARNEKGQEMRKGPRNEKGK